MEVNNEIKRVMLELALRPVLAHHRSALQRNARNLMELGISLSSHDFSSQEYDDTYQELLLQLKEKDSKTLATWMMQHF